MNHTLIMNLFIGILVAGVAFVTNDPLALLGLFFMHDLPLHVVTNEQQIRAAAMDKMDDDDDADGGGIGFTAPIK
jgi:hypothetical protein